MRLGHLTESGNCQYVQVTEGLSDDPKPRNWHWRAEVSWGKSPGEKTRRTLSMAIRKSRPPCFLLSSLIVIAKSFYSE